MEMQPKYETTGDKGDAYSRSYSRLTRTKRPVQRKGWMHEDIGGESVGFELVVAGGKVVSECDEIEWDGITRRLSIENPARLIGVVAKLQDSGQFWTLFGERVKSGPQMMQDIAFSP